VIDLGYPIVVADSVRTPLRALLRERGQRFAVLCDANVTDLAETLTRGPKRIGVFAFDLGERRKRLRTVESVLDRLTAAGADRRTAIVGVGGGVAGDLFGLAAALFMRGVPYAHVATTLVSMVDAAIGGKNGVDLAGGKNLAGTFRDPIGVFAPVRALYTLPLRHVREGLAEMVKHATIAGGETFEKLERLAPHDLFRSPSEAVVSDSVAVKTAIVHADRHEHGRREVLNLGHTFAHAIESASRYRVSHGAAVSIGLRGAGLLALSTGRFSREDHLRMLALLTLLGLPMRMRESPAAVLAAMDADKKKRDGRLRFVLPNAIGEVEYGVQVPVSRVRAVLERLARPPGNEEFR